MKIGLHTRIKNPISMGYYVFFASIKSWLPVVDRIVLVDGGSIDDSIGKLLDWCEHDPKIEIIRSDLSFQGPNFTLAQSTLNMQIGHDALSDCDWIIRIDADHVLDTLSRKEFENRLEKHSDKLHLGYNVRIYRDGKYSVRISPRSGIINNKNAKNNLSLIGWGKPYNSTFADDPIIVKDKIEYIDRDTQTTKFYYQGIKLQIDSILDIQVYRYGHFFFTPEQCHFKAKLWDGAISRTFGTKPASRLNLLCQTDTFAIRRYRALEELQEAFFPLEMKKTINAFYREGMLGGAVYWVYLSQLPCAIFSFYILARTKIIKLLKKMTSFITK